MCYEKVVEVNKTPQPLPGQPFEYRLFNPLEKAYQLMEVWQLVASNLAKMGDVSAQDAMAAAKDDDFDFHRYTRVVNITHSSGHLAGTFQSLWTVKKACR